MPSVVEEAVKAARDRIELLVKIAKEHPDWDGDRIIAYLCAVTGISEYTAEKYLNRLITAGFEEVQHLAVPKVGAKKGRRRKAKQ